MRRVVVAIFVALVSSLLMYGEPTMAKSTPNKQEADEARQSAERMQKIGEFLGIAGIVLVVLSIPVAIYWSHTRKARKQAGGQSPDRGRGRREDDSEE